jgi:7-cyano-7-deazaguanine synthase
MTGSTKGEACLVILSGGQDSTTCLYWAKTRFRDVHAVTFDYGQRHKVELRSGEIIARLAGVASHETVNVEGLLKSASPLTDPSLPVGQYGGADELPGGIEPTFIPCRNILFLTVGANRAVVEGIRDLVIGVSAVDYGGYPDCRPAFVRHMEETLRQGLEVEVKIHAPLVNMSKRDTVLLAVTLPGCMEALAYSHTCYRGDSPPCGRCHACLLRSKGFQEAGVEDPLLKRLAGS